MASPKPALLIVHGAYFVPATWQPFVDQAAAHGFEVRCPLIPTCGDSRPPKATLADDVDAVQDAAKELKAAGHPIVVLAHSFGGMVATESITPDLYAAAPRNGTTAGVIRIVYLCSHLVPEGSSLGDVFAKHGFLCDVDLEFNEDGTALPKNAPESFYNDLPRATADELTKKNVTHNLALVAQTKVTRAPYKDVPSTYVYCTQDLAIKMPLQENMVKDAQAAGGQVDTVTLDAAHCPFLSVPDQVIGVVKKTWDAAR